ncbi:hypothetical protein CDL12_04349 [Handroanthus impetiginosus]|uniref:Uncharacterized protein n=1 Tax=Handroanthus impetiginosus TaxID=429701 RepID=A0A2G9I027_9LAMI|nr:hypothetical protein CDL12_04349 [Handroanthus impetiginosus]
MQMYPSGGHTQHGHIGVQAMDDDDYHYNNNGFAHQSMQKMLDKGVPHPKQNYKWGNNYGKDEYKGSPPMLMTPDHRWVSSPKHNYKYNNMPSDGGSDQNFDNFRHSHEDYNNVQYSEDWSEDEEDYNTWNGVNDHFGLGKHQDANRYPGMSYGLEKSWGYGVHQGPHKPMVELRPYYISAAPPVWCAKGVKD